MDTFTIILAFLLFLIFIFKITTNKPTKITKLPPGPRKLPIIGNLHQLTGSLPHHRLRDLSKQYGPLMHLKIGEVSTVIVSSAEYAEQVMKTHDITFANRPYIPAMRIFTYNYADVVMAPYGECWRQLRKICTLELFSVKRVTSFKSIREDEVSKLIKWIGSQAESGTAIDLTEKLYALSNNVICRAAFGKVGRDQEKFLETIEETVKTLTGFNVADLFPSIEGFMMWVTGMEVKLEKMHREVDELLVEMIEERKRDKENLRKGEKEEKSDVILDVLLKIQENGDDGFRLTSDNVKAVISDIIGAGSETSATLVDWTISELLRNPKIMTNVQREVREVFDRVGNVDETSIYQMKYLKAVVKETLRLHPPGTLLLPRECIESCEINGFEIPKNTRVIVNAWAIGRDPKYWSQPENFIPERFLQSEVRIDYGGNDFCYIPFGAGRRICPGISFGMVTVEFSLALLLYHFDWKHPNRIIKSENLDMTEEFGVTVRRKNHTKLIPIAYHP